MMGHLQTISLPMTPTTTTTIMSSLATRMLKPCRNTFRQHRELGGSQRSRTTLPDYHEAIQHHNAWLVSSVLLPCSSPVFTTYLKLLAGYVKLVGVYESLLLGLSRKFSRQVDLSPQMCIRYPYLTLTGCPSFLSLLLHCRRFWCHSFGSSYL